MFSNEVAGAGVQRAGEKGGQDQVAQCSAAGVVHEQVVEGKLSDHVKKVYFGHWQRVYEHWA